MKFLYILASCVNAAGAKCNRLNISALKKKYCDPNNNPQYRNVEKECAKVCGIKCCKLIYKYMLHII